jgi:hypothetical protein
LRTNIYASKLIDSQDFEGLVFGALLRKTSKKGSFRAGTKKASQGKEVKCITP